MSGQDRRLLEDHLASATAVARRLEEPLARVRTLIPVAPGALAGLSRPDGEALDALLFRFNSLAGLIQDHVIRALLVVQEEDVRERSRRDQRLLMEKRGALPAGIDFGTIARLRNRVTHQYPNDPPRQAAILNDVFVQARDLLRVREALDTYARGVLSTDGGVAPPGDPP